MSLHEIAQDAAEGIVGRLEADEYFGSRILDDDQYEVLLSCLVDAIVEVVEVEV